MNHNAPESERWVPVKAEHYADSAYCPMDRERARRNAEAVIAKHFPAKEPRT